MNTEEFSVAGTLIQHSKGILVITHQSPDGDAICSAIALYLVLRDLGKKTWVGCNDDIPEQLSFLNEGHDFLSGAAVSSVLSKLNPKTDLIVAVDISQVGQFGQIYLQNESIFHNVKILNCDHHSSNTMFGDVNLVIPNYSSTTEILFDFFEDRQFQFGPDTAKLLLAGIITDTLSFSTPTVTAHTLHAAATLLDKGADLVELKERLETSTSLESARLFGQLLMHCHLESNGQIAWVDIPRDMLNGIETSRLTSDLAAQLRSLRGVRVSAAFLENDNGTVRVSLRSHRSLSVLAIAQEFGGGGHPQAAGCTLTGGSSDNAVNTIIDKLRDLVSA